MLFGGALAILLLVVTWYLIAFQSANVSMSGMMGQMMGDQYAGGAMVPMPSYVWASVVALVALVGVGIVGIAYYLAYPEIKTSAYQSETNVVGQSNSSATKESWEVVLRTSKPEERRVLEVLAAHDGTYLQKFIVKESGLSRLKTHRIVSRFVERGVVVVAKSGNTNAVSLASWLKQDATLTGSKS